MRIVPTTPWLNAGSSGLARYDGVIADSGRDDVVRLAPYFGAGLTLAFFYASQTGAPVITKSGLSNAAGAAIEAGFDYSLGGPWVANMDVKQKFLDTSASLNGGAMLARTSL